MLGAILIMLPVVLMLLYVYRVIVIKLQHRQLDRGDSIAVVLAVTTAVFYMYWIQQQDWTNSSPIWPTVLAPMGAYHIFAFGLAAYLYYRKIRGAKHV
jgi:membrane-associated HD superfamily phosphohydrolase